MDSAGETLFVRCLGAHCGNLIEVKEKNLSVCEDQGSTFFGIYGLCEKGDCSYENLVREDHFASSDLLALCPACGVKQPVTTFNWEKQKKHLLTFEARCDNCSRSITVHWKVQH